MTNKQPPILHWILEEAEEFFFFCVKPEEFFCYATIVTMVKGSIYKGVIKIVAYIDR